jgi:hypothetical protein
VKVKDKSKEKKEIEVLQHDLILFCVTLWHWLQSILWFKNTTPEKVK